MRRVCDRGEGVTLYHIRDVLDIDRTFQWGRIYLDVCGCICRECGLSITVAWQPAPWGCWGRRVTLHILFWSLTLGYDDHEPLEVET